MPINKCESCGGDLESNIEIASGICDECDDAEYYDDYINEEGDDYE